MDSTGLDGKLGRQRHRAGRGGLWAEVLLGVTSSKIFTLTWLHTLPVEQRCGPSVQPLRCPPRAVSIPQVQALSTSFVLLEVVSVKIILLPGGLC